MVAGEQQEETVADRVERQRAALPEAQDIGVEDDPAQVVELEVALEPDLRGQAGRIERLDPGEVLTVGRQLAEHRFAAPVAEEVVVLVEAHRRPQDRVVADEPHEAGLDQLVEPVVQGTAVRGRRGARQDPLEGAVRHRRDRQAVTSEPVVVTRGDVSASAACVASIVVSMSAAVTP